VAAALTAGARAAERLIAGKDEMAVWLTERLYAERPYLLERHGERGRMHTLQDMKYNIEHLAPAVALEQPSMFTGYVQWLDELLRARNVPTTEVVRTLELMRELVQARLDADEAAATVPSLDAALQMLATSA